MSPFGEDPEGTWWESDSSIDQYVGIVKLIPSQLLNASKNRKKIPNKIAKQPYGDELKEKETGTLRVYYQNINRFGCMEDLYNYMSQMGKHEVDIFG